MNKYKNDNYRGIQERTLESQVLNKPKIKKGHPGIKSCLNFANIYTKLQILRPSKSNANLSRNHQLHIIPK